MSGSRIIGRIRFVHVDLYTIGGKIYLGELTLTSPADAFKLRLEIWRSR